MVEKAFDRISKSINSPANEFVTSTLPPDPTSPSSTPTTRFLVSLATRVWWSTTDSSTSGWTVTSEGGARIEGVEEEEVVGAEPPPSPPPLAASVVIVDERGRLSLSLSQGERLAGARSSSLFIELSKNKKSEEALFVRFVTLRRRSSSAGESFPFFFLSFSFFRLHSKKSMGERPVRLPPELEDVPPRPLEVRDK